MINFNTNRIEVYNKIIHNYLDIEMYDESNIFNSDLIEYCYPKYLYRQHIVNVKKF